MHRRFFPREIRSQMRRAENRGIVVRHLASPPMNMKPLRDCLSGWLCGKKMPPLGFATNPYLLDPWPKQGIFIAEREGRVCGFLVFSYSPGQNMMQIDLIVRAPNAPNGCAELLVATAFQSHAIRGYERATLGLAPLSRRTAFTYFESPAWFRMVSHFARHLTSPFYSFAGLEAFKSKFHPDSWQPLYAVSQRGSFTPRDLLTVLQAFAGGSLVKYGSRTLMWKMGWRYLNMPGVRVEQASFDENSPPRNRGSRNPSPGWTRTLYNHLQGGFH